MTQISLFLGYPNSVIWDFGLVRDSEIRISGLQLRLADGRDARNFLMTSRQTDAIEQDSETESDKGKTLNFKVAEHFKREFKGFAASQGLSMTDLLKEGFALSKKKRQK